MVAGLAVGPERADRRHDDGKKGGEEILEEIADVEILLPRLSYDGRGVDRVGPMMDRVDVEDRVIVSEGVVPIMVPERPLRPALARRDAADEGELGVRRQRQG